MSWKQYKDMLPKEHIDGKLGYYPVSCQEEWEQLPDLYKTMEWEQVKDPLNKDAPSPVKSVIFDVPYMAPYGIRAKVSVHPSDVHKILFCNFKNADCHLYSVSGIELESGTRLRAKWYQDTTTGSFAIFCGGTPIARQGGYLAYVPMSVSRTEGNGFQYNFHHDSGKTSYYALTNPYYMLLSKTQMMQKSLAQQNSGADPTPKNDFERLMELADEHHYKSNCSVGNWSFEPSNAGSFVVLHNGETVVTCENNQIVDAKWGCRIAGVEIYDILAYLLAHVPHTHLDPMVVRTDDCLDILGFDGPSRRIADISGMEDIDYYRAWVTSKPNETDPVKMDHIVYWDQGNSWCEVLCVFKGVTHEEFVAEMHNKYTEWIREESVLEDNKEPKAPFVSQIQSASARAVEPHPSDKSLEKKPAPEL